MSWSTVVRKSSSSFVQVLGPAPILQHRGQNAFYKVSIGGRVGAGQQLSPVSSHFWRHRLDSLTRLFLRKALGACLACLCACMTQRRQHAPPATTTTPLPPAPTDCSPCRFADRIKQVKIKASKNVTSDPVAEIKKSAPFAERAGVPFVLLGSDVSFEVFLRVLIFFLAVFRFFVDLFFMNNRLLCPLSSVVGIRIFHKHFDFFFLAQLFQAVYCQPQLQQTTPNHDATPINNDAVYVYT